MPLPRSRNVVPVCVPSGTFTVSVPSSVGTSISPPSATVVKFTGIFAEQVHAVATEELVVLHVDDDVQIARRAAGSAGFALALQPQLLAGGDAGRNLHRDLALFARRGPRRGRSCTAW